MYVNKSLYDSKLNKGAPVRSGPFHVHAACQRPRWMFMPVLHANGDAEYWRECCTSMSMQHVHVHVHAACPCPCCMFLSPCCMFMMQVYAAYSFFLSMLLVLLAHTAYPCCISMLHVHAACPCYISLMHLHASYPMLIVHAECPCCMSMLLWIFYIWFVIISFYFSRLVPFRFVSLRLFRFV